MSMKFVCDRHTDRQTLLHIELLSKLKIITKVDFSPILADGRAKVCIYTLNFKCVKKKDLKFIEILQYSAGIQSSSASKLHELISSYAKINNLN